MPNFDENFVKVQFKGGSFGMKEYTAQLATRFENTKLFTSVVNTNNDGWRQHSNSERTLVNLGIVSELTPVTTLGVYGSFARNFFNVPGPLTQSQFDTAAKSANPTYLSRKEHRFNRIGAIGFTLDHAVNDMHSFSVGSYVNPKYLQRSERGTFRDFTRYHFGGHAMYKNHWDINENTKNMLMAGFDGAYQDGAILFYSLTADGKRGSTLSTNKREGARNLGLFIQDEIVFFDQTSVILGLRRDEVKYFSENYLDQKLGLQMKTYSAWIPKAGVTYRFSPSHSVYANIGGGIEVPAGNETDPAPTFGQDTVYAINPLLDPIRSTTFEVGTKQVFASESGLILQSISYDAAVYLIQVTDDIIPYRGGRFYFTAGKTRRMGFELSNNMKFEQGISLQTAFTYSNNKYIDYKIDSVHYNKNLAGHYADYGQNKAAGLPDYFYSVSLRYTPEFLKYVYTEFTIQGIGKYFADDANTTEVPQYKIFNATLGFAKPYRFTDHLFISGFAGVNNILNRKYTASAFINPDLDANKKPIFLEPGLPRNYFVALSVGWL
jgi:iron complex outermembrane receptor protein